MLRTSTGTHLRAPQPRTAATSTASGRRDPVRRKPGRGRARRRTLLVVVVLIAAGVLTAGAVVRRSLGLGTVVGNEALGVSLATSTRPDLPAEPSVPASPQPVLAMTGDYPKSGPGTWVYAGGQGQLLGTAGTLRRFRVAVETGVPEDVTAFGAIVEEVLGDPRSWIAGRTVRLQRVPAGAAAEFTVYLATPGTAYRMCAAGGLDIRMNGVPYTSCRVSGRVVVNLARWRESVPDYVKNAVPLDLYRRYVINHETGHELGHGHERCPGPGRPAPVMQQQTLGLAGCTAYAWPYLDGRRYQGPAGSWG